MDSSMYSAFLLDFFLLLSDSESSSSCGEAALTTRKTSNGEHPVTIWLFYVWLQGLITWNVGLQHWAPWVKKSPCTINCTIYYIFICSCSLLAIFISPSTWDHQLQSSDSDSADSALRDFEARPGNDSSLLLDFNFQRLFLHNLCQMIGTYKWYLY